MPIFEVTAPNGQVIEVTAPEGATEAQAIEYAKQQFGRQSDIRERAASTMHQGEGDPTEGMSGLDKALAGYGRAWTNTGRGLGQLVGAIPQERVDDAARADAPLLKTGAGTAGNVLGNVAQMIAPGGAAMRGAQLAGLGARAAPIAASAMTGGALGAALPTVGDETRLGNAAKEAALGAAGGAVGEGVAALARGGREALAPAVKALAQKAEAYGIPVTAAQMSDSAFVKTLQSALSKLPFSGQGKLYETQQAAFNRAIGRTFGVEADAITPEVAAAAKQRLGQEFDRLTAKNKLTLTDESISRIADVVQRAGKTGTADNARTVSNLADELINKSENGVVSGQAYREFDSQLGRMMRSTTDGDRRYYLGELRDAVRESMDQGIGAADKAAWGAARGQYKNLKTVEDLIEKSPSGNLSPALLMGRVRANNSNMAYGGGGDLADLARIGSQFLKQQVPDSGTAQRMLVYELAKAGVIGGGGTALGADPMTILAALALGRGGSAALNSKLLARYAQSGLGDSAQAIAPLIGAGAKYAVPAYGAQ